MNGMPWYLPFLGVGLMVVVTAGLAVIGSGLSGVIEEVVRWFFPDDD